MAENLIDKILAKTMLPHRDEDSNKGTFGKVLTIGGSFNYRGAAYLSAVSALKSGAGLVTLASIETVINSAASLCPNLTYIKLPDYENDCVSSTSFETLKPVIHDYSVFAAGPGLGLTPQVLDFINDLFLNLKEAPLVIDADALNALAVLQIPETGKNSIITPHPKELSRLLKTSVEEIESDRVNAAKEASAKYNCTTILKGHQTVVCTRDFEIFINTTGNNAIAKAGSGDVLTGIIAGLLAQGLNCADAAKLGVFLHGLSGEIASHALTNYCVLAQDIIDCIPGAIKELLTD